MDGSVVRLEGCTNFQTMISFSNEERIENVAVGDSALWQVTPNKKADLLFVKPLISNAYSNMTVVTNLRRYAFELKNALSSNCAQGLVAFEMRFRYPKKIDVEKPTVDGLPIPEKRNSNYTYKGETALVPLRVFDDGVSTFMMWPEGVASPAVFALAPDGSESVVNFANRERYIVIGMIAPAFALRLGNSGVVIFNEAFSAKGLDEGSPKPRIDSVSTKKSFWGTQQRKKDQ
jgi:type IV secretion system protein VirB9